MASRAVIIRHGTKVVSIIGQKRQPARHGDASIASRRERLQPLPTQCCGRRKWGLHIAHTNVADGRAPIGRFAVGIFLDGRAVVATANVPSGLKLSLHVPARIGYHGECVAALRSPSHAHATADASVKQNRETDPAREGDV